MVSSDIHLWSARTIPGAAAIQVISLKHNRLGEDIDSLRALCLWGLSVRQLQCRVWPENPVSCEEAPGDHVRRLLPRSVAITEGKAGAVLNLLFLGCDRGRQGRQIHLLGGLDPGLKGPAVHLFCAFGGPRHQR